MEKLARAEGFENKPQAKKSHARGPFSSVSNDLSRSGVSDFKRL